MNRDWPFRFATFITASREQELRYQSKPGEIDATEWLVLERFIDLFPPVEPEFPWHAMHARLKQKPDRHRLWAFFDWLRKESRNGEAIDDRPQGTAWAFARLLRVAHESEKPIVRQPPPLKPRTIRNVPASEARGALNRLAQLNANPLSQSEATRLRETLGRVIEAWYRDVYPYTEDGDCLDCQNGHVRELDASAHLKVCPRHPARVRLRAARLAARLAGDLPRINRPMADPHQEEPGETDDEGASGAESRALWPDRWKAEKALTLLLDPDASAKDPSATSHALLQLEAVVTEWMHYIDRTTDPCPWCGAVVPLDQNLEHLRSCPRHPMQARASLIEAQLGQVLGDGAAAWVKLVHERMQIMQGLALLVTACDVFNSRLGWTGQEAYSEEWCERPWLAAWGRAARLIGRFRRAQRMKAHARSGVRAALERLLAELPEGASWWLEEDARTLRRAAAQFDGWGERYGFATRCPACERPGVPTPDLQTHLEQCYAHPAVSRLRQYEAELSVLVPGRVDPSHLAIEGFDPDCPRDRFADYYRKDREEALAELLEYEPSELSADNRRRLEEFVTEWEEMSTVAAERCAWCGGAMSREHLLWCEAHPAVARAEALERELVAVRGPTPSLIAMVRREADRHAIAVARLVDACSAFWNGMSDGDRGKSLSNPRIEAMLKAALDSVRPLIPS